MYRVDIHIRSNKEDEFEQNAFFLDFVLKNVCQPVSSNDPQVSVFVLPKKAE
jgi:hypothetical protein